MSEEIVELPVEPAGRRRKGKVSFFKGAYDYRPLRQGYGLKPLILLFLFSFFTGVVASFPFLQPLVKHDLGVNFFQFTTLTAAVATLGTLLAGPLGYLSDRVSRTRLVGIAGVLDAIGLLGVGFGYTPLGYGAGTALEAASAQLGGVPQFSLQADYYPLEQRVNVQALLQLGSQLSAMILPIPLGIIVGLYGWRVPFWFLWMPVLVVGLLIMFWLPEPQRGYQERKALGETEDIARQEQPPPSWGEAWRAVWAVRTVRILLYAALISGFATQFAVYRQFYFIEIFHTNTVQLASIQTASNVAAVIALIVGGGVIQYLANQRPARVLQAFGSIGILNALSVVVLVLVPVLWINVALQVVISAADVLVLAVGVAVLMNVIPPRARGTALSALVYFGLPATLLSPFIGGMIDSFGLRPVVAIGAVFPIISSVILLVGSRYYESDVRNARLASVATEVYARSKREGKAKQLVCRQLDVFYGSVQVLFGVDFDVDEGELVALLGTNGAGKSTVLRAVCGLTEAAAGASVFDGIDITHIPPNEISRLGVIYMQGGKSTFPSLTVKENLDLGGWMHGRKPGGDAERQNVFDYFPVLRERLDQLAGTLSGGEQQMLALSQAFLTRPKLLLIDELSLGLAPNVVERLLEIVRAIHRGGTTIVLVEQSVNIALKVAERAVFMEKGEVRFTGPTAELLHRPDILRSVFLKGAGQSAGGFDGTTSFETGGLTASARRMIQLGEAANILEVKNVSKTFGGRKALDDVSFNLRDGEILGIIGANGAGKTTLFEVISGFLPEDSGNIVFAGEEITALSPDKRARLGLIRRFQDARLFPTMTVREAISVYFERQLEVRNVILSGIDLPATRRQEKRLTSMVDSLVELMQLQASADKFVADLSTGTRRIVDLACVIATGPKVLLLDEPSAGIAQKESEEMGPLLQRVRHQTGCSMLVIEHDMRLISAVADQLLVLNLGAVMTQGEPKSVLDDDRVALAYLGHAPEPVGVGK